MRDWNSRNSNKKKSVDWLALDAKLDSGMYETMEELRNRWAAYSDFLSRFHFSGIKRVIVEVLSEAFTVGTAGLLLMLSLALPAFELTNNTDWLKPGKKISVTFQDRAGNVIGQKGVIIDDSVPLKEIPKHLVLATLATEDRRFYEHIGVDFLGTFRALIQNVRANANVQGGSTITQQLAKNLFLTSKDQIAERSLLRKIKEAFLALWLEGHFTKDEILKLYLDRAFLGGNNGANILGVEAASQYYFGKSVRDINLAEAAILAGMYKAPNKYKPTRDITVTRARANEVLSNLVEAGYMTEGQVYGARLNPAEVVERPDVFIPQWYLDWAYDEVLKIIQSKPGDNYILVAKTTIDIGMQQFAEQTIKKLLDSDGRAVNVRQAALVSMELDGAVKAIVGGKEYNIRKNVFSRATQSNRQPGSSFKPYVYLAAIIQKGYRPGSRVSDYPVSCGRKTFRNYSGGYSGGMLMKDALRRSINTVAVDLSFKVGRKNLVKFVKKFGLTVRPSCSMALGDRGITVLQHTAGYAAFANGGKVVTPYGILEVRNSKGELIYDYANDPTRKPKQVFEVKYVKHLNEMLGLVVTGGTGRAAQLEFTTAAGKTGTTSNYKDGWFIGYTGAYVTGVWFGNDNYASMTRRGTGGNLPARAWKEYMVYAHANIRPRIPQIPGLEIHPGQKEEMDLLALEVQDTKKKKKKTTKIVKTVKILPDRTRKILKDIAKSLKKAKPLGKQAGITGNKNRQLVSKTR